MKFKQFLQATTSIERIEKFFQLCESLVVREKDSSIKKISPYEYHFSVDQFNYIFGVKYVNIGDEIIYNVYYTDDKNNIKRKNELTVKQAKQVIEKVITCLIYFIKEHDPASFSFNTDDDFKLYKFYSVIIQKTYKKKPFLNYLMKPTRNGYDFIKRMNECYTITSNDLPIKDLLHEI